jgi:hypothetical protein
MIARGYPHGEYVDLAAWCDLNTLLFIVDDNLDEKDLITDKNSFADCLRHFMIGNIKWSTKETSRYPCGASLGQSFKQLPARHRMGMIDFSNYAKAADLRQGVIWYAVIGIGSPIADGKISHQAFS